LAEAQRGNANLSNEALRIVDRLMKEHNPGQFKAGDPAQASAVRAIMAEAGNRSIAAFNQWAAAATKTPQEKRAAKDAMDLSTMVIGRVKTQLDRVLHGRDEPIENALKGAPVVVRAQYIDTRVRKLQEQGKTTEADAILRELIEQGIYTREVDKQMELLKEIRR
jgi:hypothetical protein